MSYEEFSDDHPFRLFEDHIEGGFPESEVSLFLARSGVGKSAALVNFGLKCMLEGQQVFHFSVGMTSEKVHEYYQEIYREFVERYFDSHKDTPWAELTHHLTVISYPNAENLSHDLARELNTLITNTDSKPALILVDGLDVDDQTDQNLDLIARAAQKFEIKFLATLCIHRQPEGAVDVSGPYEVASKYARRIYFLDPNKNHIRVEALQSDLDQRTVMPVYFDPIDLIFRAS